MTYSILLITLIGTAVAAFWDLRTHKIPNWITFSLMAIGLLLNTVIFGLDGFWDSLLGLIVITAILLIPFALRGIGAGDVKLLAAVGALNGLWFGIYTLLYSSLAGGAMALALALFHGQLKFTVFNLSSSLLSIKSNLFRGKIPQSDSMIITGIKFPYGLAIFIGTAATYLLR